MVQKIWYFLLSYGIVSHQRLLFFPKELLNLTTTLPLFVEKGPVSNHFRVPFDSFCTPEISLFQTHQPYQFYQRINLFGNSSLFSLNHKLKLEFPQLFFLPLPDFALPYEKTTGYGEKFHQISLCPTGGILFAFPDNIHSLGRFFQVVWPCLS